MISGGFGGHSQGPPPGSMYPGLGGPGAPPQMIGGGMPMPPMIEDDIIGAIKIKDGLFIGDEFAA
jgi:hypothetical protein